MAFAATAPKAQAAAGSAVLASAVAAVAARYARYKLFRRTLAELETLSPRDRAELGLSRRSARAAAYEAIYGAQ